MNSDRLYEVDEYFFNMSIIIHNYSDALIDLQIETTIKIKFAFIWNIIYKHHTSILYTLKN